MVQKGFEGCVGFIDGTTIPFAKRPEHKGDLYFDRSSDYSLNLQVICDIDRRIIYAFGGYSGEDIMFIYFFAYEKKNLIFVFNFILHSRPMP